MDLPSDDDCIEILKQAGCSDSVIKHSKAVFDVAVKLAKKTNANLKLVKVGSLLHDIGRSKTHGIRHAIEGAKIAKELDFPLEIINIIERHIGAGLRPEIASSLGLPFKDYRPQTLEEKIVCHADNLIDDWTRQPIEVEIKRAFSEGHPDYAEQLKQLHQELCDLCGCDINKI